MDARLRLRAFRPPAKGRPETPGRIEQLEEHSAFALGLGLGLVLAAARGFGFGGSLRPRLPRLDHDVARRDVDQAPDGRFRLPQDAYQVLVERLRYSLDGSTFGKPDLGEQRQ